MQTTLQDLNCWWT